jgi:2-iminobutanoate/2-iminopropanoate deaminase
MRDRSPTEETMSNRRSINGARARHQNPIPNASRVGNIVMSSVISGTTPGTRDLPGDLAGQMANLFAHVRSDIEAAGGSVDDIVKMTFGCRTRRRGGRRSTTSG